MCISSVPSRYKHHPSNSTGIPRHPPLLLPQRQVVQPVILQVCSGLALSRLGAEVLVEQDNPANPWSKGSEKIVTNI